MLGFAGLEVQPMNSRICAVWFVPLSGLERFLKNMEEGFQTTWVYRLRMSHGHVEGRSPINSMFKLLAK